MSSRPLLPDGTHAADYDYLREVDRAGLMWEWLRRDDSYVAWYVRASSATGGALPAPLRWRLLFAEAPVVTARHARLFWRADIDPSALRVIARPTGVRDRAGLPVHRLRRFLSVVHDACGGEHAVLSDGLHHIRLDVEEGTLEGGPVLLHCLLDGLRDADVKFEAMRRLAVLCQERRFSSDQFPANPHRERCLLLLRVGDAVRSGASQRDVAQLLVGADRARGEWQGRSDALRSRVRRLVAEARRLSAGGYRWLIARD